MRRRIIALTFFALLLAACAVPPRTPADDASIKKVAIVAHLPSQLQIRRVGLTAFNNASVLIDSTEDFSALASAALATRLRTARPSWQVEVVPIDRAEAETIRQANAFRSESREALARSQLFRRLRANGVDAVFTITVQADDQSLLKDGYGIYLRTLSTSSITNAFAMAQTITQFITIDGKSGNLRGIPEQFTATSVSPSALGIMYDLDVVWSSEVRQKVSAAVKAHVLERVNYSATKLGY